MTRFSFASVHVIPQRSRKRVGLIFAIKARNVWRESPTVGPPRRDEGFRCI